MATIPPRTLPASWYTSKPLYQLERRAVFLKSWYLLGPIIKFAPGTSVDYEFAGVHLTVNAAPPTDPSDQPHTPSITVLDSTTGTPLRHHTTTTGLIFTAISPLAPSFHTFFPNLEATLSAVDFTARPHRRSISYSGHFNWKTMIDGYQECLHCQYTHPAFSLLYPPTFYAVKNHHNWCQHYADAARPDDGLFLYFLPNCTLNVYGGGMSLFRVCPTEEPGRTRMEFDYYNVVEGEAFEEYYKFVRQVADEDFELCETVQGNLERGIYAEGVLNSVKENGVAYYQQRVLEMVLEQHQEDRQQARTRGAEGAATSTLAVEHAPARHGNSIPNRAIVEASA
ncbi:hypothetical protein LTR91_002489 [Friedmanniomyces endolithicus]|uniref:Choline monooxygenase, chloroplastic n=1 Tax=Friedmanniomyces endolithicus TaxID=329885 RepID=A0A4U0UKR0_9PEZI|nr:hypothetical protein LTS09_013279 [Friedmanniomyces endolithicus]KAK0275975.1 hypothetical protein LTR35_010744 [Friedmanniomyces endolithicus]KAK0292421.1 hypothetical protein LTS00_007898 [Friedmanniomyces endolithicus]KAK0312145.1 hypothetical protein LTR01_003059 [Friedmanniomyces endolithicus]KAK0321761.1 hypothetical protein LTR82_007247 [Friedmanniomyces endolithicus]